MKDYSNLIPTSHGFVIKYEIVGDEIHIYTSETAKGEPHKYPLSEEWLSKIEKRLENQYQLVVENREIVKKVQIKEFVSKINPTMNFGGVTCAILSIIFAINNMALCIPLSIAAPILVFGKRAVIKKYAKQIDSELDIIEAYLHNKQEIEELSQTDKNITTYLSKSASKRLSTNQSMKENGTITNAFNVDFMDKTNNQELRKMLDRYTISKALLEEQTFINPLEKEIKDSKKRTRKAQKR